MADVSWHTTAHPRQSSCPAAPMLVSLPDHEVTVILQRALMLPLALVDPPLQHSFPTLHTGCATIGLRCGKDQAEFRIPEFPARGCGVACTVSPIQAGATSAGFGTYGSPITQLAPPSAMGSYAPGCHYSSVVCQAEQSDGAAFAVGAGQRPSSSMVNDRCTGEDAWN